MTHSLQWLEAEFSSAASFAPSPFPPNLPVGLDKEFLWDISSPDSASLPLLVAPTPSLGAFLG